MATQCTKIDLQCPSCGTSFSASVWSKISDDDNLELKGAVLDGSLFDRKCPSCGMNIRLEQPLFYSRLTPPNAFAVILLPPGYTSDVSTYDRKLAELRAVTGRVRVHRVAQIAELQEIIRAYDRNEPPPETLLALSKSELAAAEAKGRATAAHFEQMAADLSAGRFPRHQSSSSQSQTGGNGCFWTLIVGLVALLAWLAVSGVQSRDENYAQPTPRKSTPGSQELHSQIAQADRRATELAFEEFLKSQGMDPSNQPMSPSLDNTFKSQTDSGTRSFKEPELPPPPSGVVGGTLEGSAPFLIRPSHGGGHYLVKLEDWSTGKDVASIFVRSGSPIEVKVPLGTYRVKYASGEKWYGFKHLFGPQTAYYKADSLFYFKQNGNYVEGYEVTLYKVIDGNLSTRRISEEDF